MAVDIGPRIGVDGEAEYRKQINNIIQQAKTLSAEMKAVAASFDESTSATEKAESTSKVLSKQIEVQKERVSALSDMLKKSADQFGENDTKTLKWQQAVYGAQAELSKMESELKKSNAEMDAAEESTKTASTAFGKLKETISLLANEGKANKAVIASLKTEYDAAKTNVANLTKELASAAKEQGVNSEETKGLAAQLQNAKEALSNTETKLKTAKSASTALGTALKTVASVSVPALAKGLKVTLKVAAEIGAKALTALKNTATTVMNALKSVASIGAKAFAALGTAAAGSILALGKIGVEYNAEMEAYQTNFETMLGSAEEAEKKVNSLKELAAKTPFEMEGLAQATQQLLAMGVASQETDKYLSQLGDISLGDQGKLDSLVNSFGKMSSTGKVTLEYINMMAEQGFNPLNEISKQTGETMTELYDRLSKGEVSFEEIKGAMEAATSAGGQFYNGMEKASKTMNGMISTLKDNARALVGEIFQPISKALTQNLLPGAIQAVDTLTEAFRKDGIDGMVNAAGEIVASALGAFTTALPGFVNTAVSIVHSLISGIKENLPVITSGAIAAAGAFLSGFVEMLPEIVGVAVSIVQSVAAGIKENSDQIASGAIEIAKALISGIGDALPDIVDAGLELIDSLLTGIDQSLSEVTAGAGNVVDTLITGIINKLPGIFESAASIISKLADGIQNNLPKVASGASQIINTLVSGIGKLLPDIIVTGVLLIGQLVAGIVKSLPQIITTAGQVVSEIVAGFARNWGQIVNIGRDVVQGIIDGIASAWNVLVSWFNDLWNSLFGKRSVNVSVNKSTTSRMIDGSHAGGLSYVPFNGYLAELHKGEMVLTKAQADIMRNAGYMYLPGNSGSGYSAESKPNVQYNFGGFDIHITQQPGEDAQDLAYRVMDAIQTEITKRGVALAG